jgi:hypothetical protein
MAGGLIRKISGSNHESHFGFYNVEAMIRGRELD